jgi:hypothetical protein
VFDMLARGDPKQIAAFEAAVTRAEQAKKGQPCSDSAASSAASPAGAGGTSGKVEAQTLDAGSAASTSVSGDEPTPAGEGRVPEWVEKCCHGMEMPSSWTAVYEGLASLRADRDRWREKAETFARGGQYTANILQAADDEVETLQSAVLLRDARIRELEAAHATLTARHDKDEAMIASLEADLAAAKARPARKYPSVEQVEAWGKEWAKELTREDFFDWLIRRAREQEGKG